MKFLGERFKEILACAVVTLLFSGSGYAASATKVFTGVNYACAITGLGYTACWGDNGRGQLGNNKKLSSDMPDAVLDESGNEPIAGITSLSAGRNHTCAVGQGGEVLCWGYNQFGKLGNDSVSETGIPVNVQGLAGPAVAVSVGEFSSCALDASGSVACWGNNDYGQLGDGSNVSTHLPVTVNGLAGNVTTISAGYWHVCALVEDEGVKCWGRNDAQQLGSSEVLASNVPLLVPGLGNEIMSVAAGAYHTCALSVAGGVWCWGGNDSGQLGIKGKDDAYGPVAVSGLGEGVKMLAAGFNHTCALLASGRVKCWGGNIHGQLGHGGKERQKNVPVLVQQLNGEVDSIDARENFTCAVMKSGAVKCWGELYETNPWEGMGSSDYRLPVSVEGFDEGAALDKTGSAVAFAGDVDADGYGDYVVGRPGYDVPGAVARNAGRAEIFSGKTEFLLMRIEGKNSGDAMGFAVAGNGDVDNDGYADVLVGAPKADDAVSGIKDTGSVTLLYGPDGTRHEVFTGPAAKSQFGYAVALGDVYNDDGHADILIGAPTAPYVDAGFKAAGSVSLINGSDLSSGPVMYGADQSLFGASLAVGDVAAVGGMSAIVGSPGHTNLDNGARRAGAVFVARYAGMFVNSPVRFGAAANMRLGTAVAAGDLDGDDDDEVLAGAPTDNSGDVKLAGSAIIYSSDDLQPQATLYGAAQKARFGNSIAVGDVNGDGHDDILVGAPKDDAPANPKITKDAGSVSVFSGNGYATLTTLYGEKPKDYFGTALSAGDINSDGKADLIIGIPGFDVPGTKPVTDAGAVKVISGNSL